MPPDSYSTLSPKDDGSAEPKQQREASGDYVHTFDYTGHHANFFFSFSHLSQLFSKHYRSGKQLSLDDLGTLRPEDSVQWQSDRFSELWEEERGRPVKSFWRPFLRLIGWRRPLVAVLYQGIAAASQFVNPLVLKALTGHLSGSAVLSKTVLWFLVTLLLVAPVINACAHANSVYLLNKMGVQTRNALSGVLYKKLFHLSNTSRSEIGVGQIINVFSSDTNQIQMTLATVGTTLLSPAQLAVAFALIYFEVGVAMFTAMAVVILFIPVIGYLSLRFAAYIKLKLEQSDKRIKMTQEVLTGVRVIKLYGWERAFLDKIAAIRLQEVLHCRSIYLVWIAMELCISVMRVAQPIAIFYTYTALGNELTYSKSFTTLALFSLLIGPIMGFPALLNSISYAQASAGRILNLLMAQELQTYVVNNTSEASGDIAVEVVDGNFGWVLASPTANPAADTAAEPEATAATLDQLRSSHTLRHINVRIQKGSFVGLVGPVGAGKSSFLSMLLGEMQATSRKGSGPGTVTVNGRTAYHQQSAWIINATIRDNILFQLPYEESRFHKVLADTCLDSDVLTMPAGVDTEIGEKGINLSGGQRARLSLARALYSDSDVFLLDDPLSAVDATVGRRLCDTILELSRKRGKTVILATHQFHCLTECDSIIYLDERGSVGAQDTFSNLTSRRYAHIGYFAGYGQEGWTEGGGSGAPVDSTGDSSSQVGGSKGGASTGTVATPVAAIAEDVDSTAFTEEQRRRYDGVLITQEERSQEQVKAEVYRYYLHIGGAGNFVLVIAVTAVGQALSILSQFLLASWGAAAAAGGLSQERNLRFVGTYAWLLLLSCVFYSGKAYFSMRHAVRAGSIFHNELLACVLKAKVSFFDVTPLGRIVNRFTSDTGYVDQGMTAQIALCISTLGEIVAAVLLIAITTAGTVLILLVPLLYVYSAVQRYYRKTNTDMKRLLLVTKSPVIEDFSQALGGVVSIRCYGYQETFWKGYVVRMNRFEGVFFLQSLLQCWFWFRLTLLSGAISFFVAALTVSTTTATSSFVPAEYLAIALSASFTIPWFLAMLANLMTEAEAGMASVERIKFYRDNILPEESAEDELLYAQNREFISAVESGEKMWPSEGRVEVRGACMCYRGGPLILDDVTMTADGGERVGIAGRTGSGKSSLMLAMFRINPLLKGDILIDGVSTRSVPLSMLRRRLGIIPQEPFMFTSTLRYNLDPFHEHADARLWEVLGLVGLMQAVEKLERGLSEEVLEGGENLSTGQRQLVCFARTLLQDPRILFLDEATSSIDSVSDEAVQAMLRRCFVGRTVVTIAHRLRTIEDSDRVLVLEGGRVREYAPPAQLLSQAGSAFREMWESAGLHAESRTR